MKHWLILVAAVLILAGAVVPALRKGSAYSGPGIGGNLRYIQSAKELWLADGHTNQWPSAEDLFGWSEPLQERMRSRYGELYFINQIGAPPFAYFPKAGGQYKAGDLLVLTSNGVVKVRQ